MPRIPQYSGPQLDAAPLPQPYQDVSAMTTKSREMGALGNALMDASNASSRIAERKEINQAYDIEIQAKTEFMDFERELRKSRRGNDAVGISEEIRQWWAEAPAKYGEGLSPAGRKRIGRSLAAAQLQHYGAAVRYEEQEVERAADETYAAGIQVEIDRAIATGDPAATAASQEVIRRNVSEMAARKGWSAEQVEAETKKYSTRMHKAMVDVLVETDPAAARAYLDKAVASGEVMAEYQDDLEKTVSIAETSSESLRMAAEMAGLPYSEQLARTAAITDPRLRDAVHTRIRQQQADVAAVRAEQERVSRDELWSQVAAGTRVEDLSPSLLAAVDGREIVQAQEYQRQRTIREAEEAAGKYRVSEPAAYNEVMTMTPQQLASPEFRPEKYHDKLSNSDYNTLVNAVKKAKDPKNWNEVSKETDEIKIYTANMTDAQKMQFMQAYWTEKEAFAAKNKGLFPPFEEREKIFTKLFTVVDPGALSSEKPLYQVDANELADSEIDVDEEQYAEAVAEVMQRLGDDVPGALAHSLRYPSTELKVLLYKMQYRIPFNAAERKLYEDGLRPYLKKDKEEPAGGR